MRRLYIFKSSEPPRRQDAKMPKWRAKAVRGLESGLVRLARGIRTLSKPIDSFAYSLFWRSWRLGGSNAAFLWGIQHG